MPRDVENDSFQIKAAKWASQRRNNIAQFPLSCCLSISLGFLGEGRSGQGRERQGGREEEREVGGSASRHLKWLKTLQGMKNQQAPWSHASSPMPPSPSKEWGIKARKAVVPKGVGSEDDDDDNDAETAFEGYKNQFICCCLVPAMGCSTRWTTFVFPSESFATPRWPQGGDSQGALARWLVFITEMKPVRRLCSASPAPHYRVRLCLCERRMWLHLEMGALKSKWWTWREVMRPGPDPHMTVVLKRREFRHEVCTEQRPKRCAQRRTRKGYTEKGPEY